MTPTDLLLFLFSSGIAVAGTVMVNSGVNAYLKTQKSIMIYLSIGFTLIVAGTLATFLGGVFTDFQNGRLLLAINNGFAMFGYVFVVYSVISYN